MTTSKKHSGRYRHRHERYISPGTKWAVALSALAIIGVAVLIVAFLNGWIALPEFPREPVETAPPTVPAEDTVVHFVAGGDVNITDRVVGADDFAAAFLDVLPVLSASDLTALNFEGSACGAPYGSAHGSAPAQLLTALRNAGVDVLQTANSQSLTNGLLGLSATAQAIQNAGMQNLGTYADKAAFEKHQGFLVYEIKGIRIALVAFTKGMDGRNLPAGSEHCVNLLYKDYSSTYKKIDEDGIKSILRSVKTVNPDIIISLVHWGSEYNDQISKSQEKIIKLMAEQGVDALIGTHAHYVQPMGFHKDSGMFVAHCLGDFLGDAQVAGTQYSVLLDLQITRSGATGEVAITGYDYTPIYQHYDENGALKLLRIREAIAAYENDYIGKVPEDVYNAMKTALTRIENRVKWTQK